MALHNNKEESEEEFWYRYLQFPLEDLIAEIDAQLELELGEEEETNKENIPPTSTTTTTTTNKSIIDETFEIDITDPPPSSPPPPQIPLCTIIHQSEEIIYELNPTMVYNSTLQFSFPLSHVPPFHFLTALNKH